MRIYDTFLFDCELDLLEHRLRENFDLIDVFVLVEAAETFPGQPKALIYRHNRERFAWASKKIRHVALESLGAAGGSPWRREALQRNAIMLGLRDAEPGDIVLILDADEIPARPMLERLRAEGLARPHRLSMTRHYEYLDVLAPGSACCPPAGVPFPFYFDRLRPPQWEDPEAIWWERTAVAARFVDLTGDAERVLPARSAYDLRRLMQSAPALPNAGRHLVSTDPAAHLASKLAHVSHAELASARGLSRDHLTRVRRYAVHHHGWWYAEQPLGVLPPDLQRLAERCPAAKRGTPPPGALARTLVRTWAWLRFWPRLSDALVRAVDSHFERWIVLLFPALLASEGLRRISARWGWRWLRGVSPAVEIHEHSHG